MAKHSKSDYTFLKAFTATRITEIYRDPELSDKEKHAQAKEVDAKFRASDAARRKAGDNR